MSLTVRHRRPPHRRLEPRWAARLATTVLLAGALAAAGCGDDPLPPLPPAVAAVSPPPHAWVAEVTAIVDGDTLRAVAVSPGGPPVGEEVRLRLLRVDTPERARGGGAAECLAEAATRHLERLLPVGSTFRAAHDVELRDRYGRDLVHVWDSDGEWVNGRMLADGFAQVVTYPPNVAFDDEVQVAVAAARDAQRGLWAPGSCS